MSEAGIGDAAGGMARKYSARICRAAVNADAARLRAKSRLPRIAFDFIDGGVGREACLARNVQAFDRVRLMPRGLVDVSRRSLKKRILGFEFDLPFGIAPMGMCGLAGPGADRLIAREAKRRDVPWCVSSAASISLEDARAEAGRNAWFQLYVGSDTSQALSLLARAKAAGYETLVLTVDVPVLSRRDREVARGYGVPVRVGLRQLADFALHPLWSAKALVRGIPRPGNYDVGPGGYDRDAPRAGADWDFLDWLRAEWPGKLVVKGVLCSEIAVRAKDAGADAVCVSNHGGRQLDSAPAALEALPEIRKAVGPDYPLLMDSGVRHGEDVLRALALGADCVLLGRPILYAIAAGGEAGLAFFLDGFAEGVSSALAQVGLRDINDVGEEVLAR